MNLVSSHPDPSAQAVPSPQTARRHLWALTMAHAVTHMQSSVLPMIYPLLMRGMGFGYVELGAMLSITRLIGGLLQGIWGPIARYIPLKYLIGFENFGISASMGWVSGVHSLPELTSAVTFGQVVASPQHPLASSALSRWFGARRGTALSVHFAGGNIGTVISPLLATALLARVGWQHTLQVLMIPGLLVGFWVLWQLPAETEKRASRSEHARASGRAFGVLLRDRRVLRLLATASVTAGGKGLGILNTFVPLLLIRGLHLPTVTAGLLFSLFTATSVIGPTLAGRLSDRYDRPRFLSILLVLSALTSLATALLYHHATWVLMGVILLMGLVVYAYSPIEQAILGDVTDQTLSHEAYSLFYSVTFATSALWPLILSLVLNRWGYPALFATTALSYAVGAWVYGTRDWGTQAKTA